MENALDVRGRYQKDYDCPESIFRVVQAPKAGQPLDSRLVPTRKGRVRNQDIFVIGASAGGVEAVISIVRGLPRNLRATVFVVVHVSPMSTGLFAGILNRESAMAACHPKDRARIKKGSIYVAPPDMHMVIEGRAVRVIKGPKLNMHRPAIDPLFWSAARYYGDRVAGIILTGFLDDGAAGLAAVKSAGGVAIVQRPEEALAQSMPAAALKKTRVDYRISLGEMPELILQLSGTKVRSMPVKKSLLNGKNGKNGKSRGAKANGNGRDVSKTKALQENGKRDISPFTCPDCHGTIWEVLDEGGIRFECRVGHSYSPETMAQAHEDDLERALWASLRTLEESLALLTKLAENSERRGSQRAAQAYRQRADERSKYAAAMRKFLTGKSVKMPSPSIGIVSSSKLG